MPAGAARLIAAGAGSGATGRTTKGSATRCGCWWGWAGRSTRPGCRVGPDRVAEAVRAAATLDPTRRTDLYWAGRLTLCANPDDLPKYDAVFAALTAGDVPRLRPRPQHLVRAVPVTLAVPDAGGPASDEETEAGAETVLRAAASTVETLRHKDVTTLGAAERAELDRALAALSLPGESRPSRRRRPSPHPGAVDPRRTVRALLRSGGEPVRPTLDPPLGPAPAGGAAGRRQRLDERVRRRAAAVRARGHPPAAAPATEVFTLGTRLTRVTREMAGRGPGAGDGARSPGRCRTGPAAPGSARCCGSSWTAGGSAAWPAARSS